MYHEYTQDELRSYCKQNIETLEIWARRLIHEKMTEEYGNDYINHIQDNGEHLIKRELRDHISKMITNEPNRYKKPIDTIFIDQIIYFLCNPKWYNKLFKKALDYIYPQGRDEAREFLKRLIPIRNPLSHSNPISMHQVEQAICYSHDFIEGLKQYYKERGEEQVWNVPKIIKIKDSMGNIFENFEEKDSLGVQFKIPQNFNIGDIYTVEIEIDSSFREDEYSIEWKLSKHNTSEFNNSTKFTIQFSVKDVSQMIIITCLVKSKKDWHKYTYHDSKLMLLLTVLPPIE